jgi:RecA-family ATPase
MELAADNGAQPDIWSDALLAAWDTLDRRHRASFEKFEPVDLSQFPDPTPLRDIWEGHITEGLISTLYGDSGQGKSTLVDGLATHVATGRSFLGYQVLQGPVVILDWELNRDITLHRLYRIARGLGMDVPPAIMYQSYERSPRNTLI